MAGRAKEGQVCPITSEIPKCMKTFKFIHPFLAFSEDFMLLLKTIMAARLLLVVIIISSPQSLCASKAQWGTQSM